MQEESIFHAALALTADRRGAYLDEACRGNDAQRLRLERMLHAHENPGSFLAAPRRTIDPAAPDPTALHHASLQPVLEKPGMEIGPYKLMEQLGEGGMGLVFVAQQEAPVRRRVALKVIKPGMDTRECLARFEAERQALALMDHPNIARVLDAGATASGRPYFVMELVRGVPITQYCDDSRLSPRQRMELFVQVCQAVQHAHQKGIIHRDLKPTNVLVASHDGTPVVKVIDFGVAKAIGQQLTEQTIYTAMTQMVGTPLYMSPEQAGMSSLDIDTRSDIYSLGVLLYELLTGTTPFDKKRLKDAAFDEIRRIIREDDPPKPSTKLSSSDTLASVAANRSMEPSRLSRTVRGELDWIVMKSLEKDRNRRYETANSLAMDLQRYLADEPVLACPPSAVYRFQKFARRNKVSLAVAALVLLFLVLMGGGIGWAIRDRAIRQANVAGQVEQIFAEVDRLESEQKWAEAMAVVQRAEAAVSSGDADAHTAKRVRERLKDLAFIDRLEQIRMQWKSPEEGDAGANRNFAEAFREYGVDVEALTVEASIERLKARPTLLIPLAAALDAWVWIRFFSSEDTTGSARLIAIARAIDPDPIRDQIRSWLGRPTSRVNEQLVRMVESIDVRAHNRTTLYLVASMLRMSGKKDAAIRILQQAVDTYPEDYWLNVGLGQALVQDKQDMQGAIRFLSVAAGLRPYSTFNLELADALMELGRLDEGAAIYRRYIERDPKNSGSYWYRFGGVLQKHGNLEEAADACRKSVELGTGKDKMWRLVRLGDVLRDQGKFDEAQVAYRKAIDVAPSKITLAYCYFHFGDALAGANMLEDAIAAYHKTMELEPWYGPDAYFKIGDLQLRRKDYAEATAAYDKAIAADPKRAADAYLRIGQVQMHQNNRAEAIAAFSKAIDLNDKVSAPATNDLAWLLVTCSDTQFRDPAQAIRLAKKAVELDPTNGYYANTLGVAHYRAGNWSDAVTALEKSMDLRSGGDSIDWFFLGMAHWQLGQKEKARQWYDRAVQWMDKNEPNSEELRPIRAEAEDLLKKLD